MTIPLVQYITTSFLFLFTGLFWGSWLSIGRSFQKFPLSEFVHIARVVDHNLRVSMRLISIPCLILMIGLIWIMPDRSVMDVLAHLISILLTLSALLITVLVQVPMNNQIITWTEQSAPADWKAIRNRWQFYNTIRTAAAVSAFLIFTAMSFNII